MSQAIQTAIVGVTGYAGAELVRLLVRHPRLAGKPPVLAGRIEPEEESRGGIPLSQIHPALIDLQGTGNLRLRQFRWEMIEDLGVDVLFLATPHEYSRTAVFEARRRNIRVIDLSGAWRLESSAHRAVYAFEDEGSADALAMQAEAVYGMPELHRHALHGAGLIANPGCYATAAILALKPLLAAGIVDPHCGIVCDAKSGVSGAGKAPTAKTHFMYAADNFSAYGVFSHRHAGELIEQLEIDETSITFTPHLLPIPRGILATSYVRFLEPQSQTKIDAIYREFYNASPMVRLHGHNLPQIQHSVKTSYCDIGWQVARDGHRAVIVSCLDNLLKGAAGQAVQNLNVMMGWAEAEGLE